MLEIYIYIHAKTLLYIYLFIYTHTHIHIRFLQFKIGKNKTDWKHRHKLIINQKYWSLSSIQIYNPNKFPWIKSSVIKLKPLSLMSIRSEGEKRKTCSTVSHSSLNCTSSLQMTTWLSNHKCWWKHITNHDIMYTSATVYHCAFYILSRTTKYPFT